MGNVLLNYRPGYALDRYCDTPEEKAVLLKEFFGGREWIETDIGTMTPAERSAAVKKRLPERFHAALELVSAHWDECMTPLDGAADFLEFIKEKGLGLYLLSNASSEFYSYFPREIDTALFDGIVVSSDLKMIKPQKEIYEYLLNKYSLNPGECLFIDDLKANSDAAEECGIHGFVFCGSYEEVKEKWLND